MIICTGSALETRALAAAIGELARPADTIVLSGDLGAGKTTFAQGIATGLGVRTRVTSPTFTLVRTHPGRVPLVHIDVYRLEQLQELHDLGFDELVGGEAVVVIEWGDVLGALLPADRLEVHLDFVPGAPDARHVTVTTRGGAWSDRALADALSDFDRTP